VAVHAIEYVGGPGDPSGLLLHVTEHDRRPPWRLEATDPYLLRLHANHRAVLWMRIDPWWSDASFVRDIGAIATSVIPPIDARVAEGLDAVARGTSEWFAGWMRYLAGALDASARGPLHDGAWRMAPVVPGPCESSMPYPGEGDLDTELPAPHSLDRELDRATLRREHWFPRESFDLGTGGVVATRALTPGDRVRLNAWRKSARHGTLAPVLLAFVHVLGKYIVLDGHVRLEAGRQAGVVPPLIALWPVREAASSDRCVPKTRAFAIAGGRSQWVREARERLGTRRAAIAPEVIDDVLWGLER
jgi:hypothetical protein